MDAYQTYKDSGIIWVGQTPQHWSEEKIKFLFKEKKSTPNLSLNCGSISFGRVVFKDDDSIPSSRKETYQEVLDGEFLINPLNLNYDLKSLRIARSDKNVVVSPGYMVLQLQRQSDSKFFEFLLHVFDTEHMKSLGSGVRQTISFNHLKTEQLPIPPIDEQRKIGQYLDRKTTLIDSLIEKTVRKIELLKEKRTSLINEVVTKGLNPDVEMKDSGVEWIGEIPSHWERSKIRFLTDDHRQGYYSSRPYDDDGFSIVRITDIGDDNSVSTVSSPRYQLTGDEFERFGLKKGDFLFPRTGGVGRFGIFSETSFSIYGSFLIRFRFKERINESFLKYYFQSSFYLEQILSEIHGGVNQNVHVENIKDCFIYVTSDSEQEQIVEYLDEQTSIIDSTITTEEKRVELLKEYRQSLISEVVTGKVKVTTDE